MSPSTDRPSLKPSLMSLLALVLAAGCGGPLEAETEALGQHEAAMERTDPGGCTSGNCSDPTNGQGIYVAKGFGYCIWLNRETFYCPEFFSQSKTGPQLTGQTVNAKGETIHSEVTFPVTGRRLGLPVTLQRLALNGQDLVIAYSDASGDHEASGSELLNLELDLKNFNQVLFTLRFRPVALESGVMQYRAEYFRESAGTWQPTCQDGVEKVAFLPERKVDPVRAKVALDTESEVLTMACRTGAIVTCMVWGYRPYEQTDPDRTAAIDVAYASCLQAKRAAYFVKSGDYASYTAEGTHIEVQDWYGFMNGSMPGVEAVWGPEGASCFSPTYRRIPKPGVTLPSLPAVLPVPDCDQRLHNAAHQGTLQLELGGEAPLATGPSQI